MKHQIIIRFYEELNDFLPSGIQKQDLCVKIDEESTVGNFITSFGIPYLAVDLILVNGRSVDFSYILERNDRVSVYPVFEKFDISSITTLRNTPLRNLKFICDAHLGKLAKYLRMLGFDTWYAKEYSGDKLSVLSEKRKRIILTKSKKMLKTSDISRGYQVQSSDPRRQLYEIVNCFDLKTSANPLSRCLTCNGSIEEMGKEALLQRLKPTIFKKYDTFYRCTVCDHLYWHGSHFESMMKWIDKILN